MAFLRDVKYMIICDECSSCMTDYISAKNIKEAAKKAEELGVRKTKGKYLCFDCLVESDLTDLPRSQTEKNEITNNNRQGR